MFNCCPLHQPCGYKCLKIRATLANNRKSDMPDSAWRQLAKELHEYGGRVAVYTDGSVKDGRAACAVYSDQFKLVS